MRALGIIAEYNPFHFGHQFQIEATRQALGANLPVVCVMSGNWTQRGRAALTDKWTRAALALHGGVDLVLELPTPWATSSAEGFARGGVEVLTRTGVVDTLCFGSECGSLDELAAAADALDGPDYPGRLKAELERGLSYAAARSVAVGHGCLDNPNNNLAVEYLRAIRVQGSPLGAFTVQRQGAGHDAPHTGTGEGFASASAIRAMLRAGNSIAWDLLPAGSRAVLGTQFADLDRAFPAILARLRTMTALELREIPDCSEGLEYRILEGAGRAGSLDELYTLAKSKRYAHARIRRVILRAFLGVTELPAHIPYLRVLGMTGRGRELLRQMEGIPVITKPAHGRGTPLLEAEARWTDLYGLCFEHIRPSGLEWTTSPVVLE